MRIRTVKPDFWGHPVMSKQSDATKLLALGLLNLADDDGYFYAEPRMVRNAIRPLDDDSRITTVSLRELSEIGYIEIRNHPTHGHIGFIPSFSDHQVINKAKPSKIKGFYDSVTDTVPIPYRDGQERKGKEQGMEQDICPLIDVPKKQAKAPPPQYDENVIRFWEAYPIKGRGERSSRKKVDDEWRKIKSWANANEILESMRIWSKSHEWQKDGGQFVPGLHTWLKERRWEDLPASYAASVKRQATERELKGL